MHSSPQLDRHSCSIQTLPNEINCQQKVDKLAFPSNPSANATFYGSDNINISKGSPRLLNANSVLVYHKTLK